METETVTISRDLLDAMVRVMGEMPYLQVQPIFAQMAHELTKEEPKIHIN